MKKLINLMSIYLVAAILNSCTNDPTIPVLTTSEASNITDSTAICGGAIINNGDAPIIEQGICLDTISNPTLAHSYVLHSSLQDSFLCTLTLLEPNTTYYVRSFAKNKVGIGYGNEINFTTSSLRKYLMAHYPFNGNANDASGKGHNGIVYGTLTLTTDRKGNTNSAYQFNGTNSYIEVPASSDLKPLNAITLSTWFYIETPGKTFDDMIATSYKAYYYPYSSYYICKMSDSVSFCITTLDEISTVIRSGTKINCHQWYHAVGTYDGQIMKLYLNGHLEISAPKSGNIVYNTNPLKFGHGVYNQFLTGKLDDIRIFNKALTESEVLQLYNE